jgi:hypothetical protein
VSLTEISVSATGNSITASWTYGPAPDLNLNGFTVYVNGLPAAQVGSPVRSYSTTGEPGKTYTFMVVASVSPVATTSNTRSITLPPAAVPMQISLDTGGWPGVFGALVGVGLKHVRMSASRTSAPFATTATEAEAAGMTISSVIFGETGTIGSLNPTTYAQGVVSVCKAHPHIDSVEVLNEPGGSWFWKDAMTATSFTAYVALVKATREAMQAAGLTQKLLMSWDGGRVEPLPGGTAFGRACAAALPYVDGVVVHPYGGGAGQCGGRLLDRKKVEAAISETGKPVYITEVGRPTAIGKPNTGDSQQCTEAEQLEDLKAFVAWCRSTGKVANVTIFNYEDYGTNNWYGVKRPDGTKKPLFAALGSL